MMRSSSPASCRTRATNCAPLAASRTALVATASMRVAPSCRASVAMRPTASTARSIAVVPSTPVTSMSALPVTSVNPGEMMIGNFFSGTIDSATARSAIVESSVSPDRCDITAV